MARRHRRHRSNPAAMRRRTRTMGHRSAIVPRAPGGSGSQGMGVVLLVGAAIATGLAIYLWPRSSSATTLPSYPVVPGTVPPSTPETPIAAPQPQPTQAPPPRTPPPSTPVDRRAALLTRLRAEDHARLVYAFQDLLYAYNYTNDEPDGIFGPITQGWVREVYAASGFPHHSANDVTGEVYSFVPGAMRVFGKTLVRPGPSLPADIITLVNQTINRRAPGGSMLLQANPE